MKLTLLVMYSLQTHALCYFWLMLVANPGYQKPPAKEPATEAAKLDPAVKATKMWLEPVTAVTIFILVVGVAMWATH